MDSRKDSDFLIRWFTPPNHGMQLTEPASWFSDLGAELTVENIRMAGHQEGPYAQIDLISRSDAG